MDNYGLSPDLEKILKYLPKYLKYFREKADFTIDDAAAAIKKSKGTLSNWENGKGIPTFVDIINICALYNISLYDLIPSDKDTKEIIPTKQDLVLIKKIRNADTDVKTVINKILEITDNDK